MGPYAPHPLALPTYPPHRAQKDSTVFPYGITVKRFVQAISDRRDAIDGAKLDADQAGCSGGIRSCILPGLGWAWADWFGAR